MGLMRWVLGFVMIAAAACGSREEPLRRADGSEFVTSGGEVSLSDGSRLDFSITSERYKQWDAAQQSLDRRVVSRFGQVLNRRSPTESSINKAVSYLLSQPAARQAIERTGMSVRDFVMMTVALDQEMQLAESRGVPQQPLPMPMPMPYPVDTTFVPPSIPSYAPPDTSQYPVYTPAPVTTPTPLPPTSVDTTFRRPYPTTPTTPVLPPPRDTSYRDSLRRRDSLFAPRPRPDSVRDTTRPPRTPPDTLVRTAPPDTLARTSPPDTLARR